MSIIELVKIAALLTAAGLISAIIYRKGHPDRFIANTFGMWTLVGAAWFFSRFPFYFPF